MIFLSYIWNESFDINVLVEIKVGIFLCSLCILWLFLLLDSGFSLWKLHGRGRFRGW